MDLRTVGVVGAGVMGKGLAEDVARSGHKVILIDISQAILDRARATIARASRLNAMLQKEKLSEEPANILENIECSTDYGILEGADFVIENITEKWEVKEEAYPRIDAVCNRDCVIASNTSAIPIARLAGLTTRPEKVIGTHFMNPVPLKPVVEVIRGKRTSEETLERTKQLLRQMRKEWVIVNDAPGFVSNRVLMLTINEAISLLQDHVASAEDVDRIFKTCFGHPMGPLETADLIGLDTILYSLEVLRENFNDDKFQPCSLLREMVEAGFHGRKNGRGFFEYVA